MMISPQESVLEDVCFILFFESHSTRGEPQKHASCLLRVLSCAAQGVLTVRTK